MNIIMKSLGEITPYKKNAKKHDETQMNALRLVDNKSNESEWDFDLLAEELPELDLSAFDFDWGLPEDETEEVVEDKAPEVDEESEPITKLGDIWQLGRHRLMCGDSTSVECVQKLLGGGTSGPFAYRPAVWC